MLYLTLLGFMVVKCEAVCMLLQKSVFLITSRERAWIVLRLKTKGHQIAQVALCINIHVLLELKVYFFLI